MTIEERINELGEKYEKQKEINKELVDENHKLADCNARLLDQVGAATKRIIELEKENEQLKSIAEFQQSSNMKRHFEIQELKKKNKELDVFLNAGTTFNKALNSTNKVLEEERDRYRNMVFDQKDLLTKAKGHIENLLYYVNQCTCERSNYAEMDEDKKQAGQFLQEIEK